MEGGDTVSIITVLALKAGDERAFEDIYQQFSNKLYGKLLKLVKSEYVAQELLQDLFLKIWEKRDQIDPDKSFSAYLFHIAENLAYDFFRKAARDKRLQTYLIASVTELNNSVDEALINKEYNRLIQQAIDALPPRRRQIFKLCKLDGKSYEEVAMQLRISTSTVNDHIVKATRFIRKYCYAHNEILLTVCLCTLFSCL